MDLQHQLFTAALGIYEPTFISDVTFENNELHITLDFYRGGEFPCPICGELHKVYDTELKTWRHLNFFQFKCYLHFHTPRVNCPTCGKHRYQVPWSRPQSGFTQLFEAFVLTLAKSGMPISTIAKIMGENDTRIRRVIDFHVEEAYAKRDFSKVRKVCVDETSSKKGHKYITVFSNPKDKTVLFATPGKDSSTFVEFAKEAKKHGLDAADKITEVTIDMSEAFQKGAKEQLPKASVTFDRFHVIKLLNEAIDKVRRIEQNENKELSKTLKNSRYCWLKNQENLTNRQIGTLEKLLAIAIPYDIWNCYDSGNRCPPPSAASVSVWLCQMLTRFAIMSI